MTCPACAAPVLPGHAFCEDCGHPLPLVSCTACGGAVDEEAYCVQCGLRQPDPRDHQEAALANGTAGVSDRGLRHQHNEDAMALTALDGLTIAVVCDGVSNSPRPELASAAAAENGAAALRGAIEAGQEHEEATRIAYAAAARAVVALATSPRDAPACTYVSAVAGPGRVTVGWVGDSRAYWLPDTGAGRLLTEDDVASPGLLTAWLGADAGQGGVRVLSLTPDRPGRLLVCTDGLWGYLEHPEALRTPQGPPADSVRELLSRALDAGGRDNITVVLIPVNGGSP